MGSACTLTRGRSNGWEAVTLANGLVEVTVLPGKGADITRIVDRATGIDALFHAPWGEHSPDSPALPGTEQLPFLQHYAGGWQELFPNLLAPCEHRGRGIPFHGEVATRAWAIDVEQDSAQRVSVAVHVECECAPLTLTRHMTLVAGSSALTLRERVSNRSGVRQQFVWGHHIALGWPFIDEGCTFDTTAVLAKTPEYPPGCDNQLVGGRETTWPLLEGVKGTAVDLRNIRGPTAATADAVYLSGFNEGRAVVRNPSRRLRFTLEWERQIFPWLVNWRPFGGAFGGPLSGIYALGLEPWSSELNLAAAVAAGQAHELEAHGEIETVLIADFGGDS